MHSTWEHISHFDSSRAADGLPAASLVSRAAAAAAANNMMATVQRSIVIELYDNWMMITVCQDSDDVTNSSAPHSAAPGLQSPKCRARASAVTEARDSGSDSARTGIATCSDGRRRNFQSEQSSLGASVVGIGSVRTKTCVSSLVRVRGFAETNTDDMVSDGYQTHAMSSDSALGLKA